MVWAVRKSLKLVKSWLLNSELRSGCGTETRVMLGVIMGRGHSAEQGQEVDQLLGDSLDLWPIYPFSFFSSKNTEAFSARKGGNAWQGQSHNPHQ